MPKLKNNEKKIRILTVITKLELGGAQQVALHALRGLSPQHYEKHLIAGQDGLLDAEAKGIPQVQVHLWKSFKHPIRPWSDGITFFRLVHYMRKHRIDMVHTHSSKAGLLGRWAARIAKVPVIIHTVHGWPFHIYQAAPVRWFYVWLERLTAGITTTLIAVSQATQDKGLKYGIGKSGQYQVIFPASDLRAFTPGDESVRLAVRREFGFSKDAPLVGMVACLKPQKAPLDFVRAARVVVKANDKVRFLLVGDGRERRKVEKEIEQSNLSQHVVLTGWRKDVNRLMKALDVFVLTSLWEGLPCVFAQAMATGLPIIATDVEGAHEAIQDGDSGLLVAPNQPEDMGKAMLELLGRPRMQSDMRHQALALVGQFKIEPMLRSLEQVYQAAWAAKRPSGQ